MKKFCIISVILFYTLCLSARDAGSINKKEIKFIRELYESGRYFDCIAEAERIQIREKRSSIEYFIYANYYLAGQYSTILNNYNADLSSPEMQFHSLLLLSNSFLKKEMYFESYETLKNYDYKDLPEKYMFAMFLRRVEPLILSGEDNKIDREIAGSGIFLEDSYNYVKLREELQMYKADGLKSSTYAALMSSVVPGLGQCYAGYPGEGLISLLSIAATAAGGLYMRDAGKKSFSYTLFFFSGLFYGGNIYGAYNSAVAANDEVIEKRHQSIVSRYGTYNPGEYMDIESVFK